VAVVGLAVLVAGAIGTYSWALGHWFVGVNGTGAEEQVAVFRGLNVSVVGFDLYELDRDAGLPLTDLTKAARNRVRHGITADDAGDADRILAALRDQRLPLCRTATPTPSPPASETPVPTTPPAGEVVPTTEPPPADGTSAAPSTSTRTTTSPEPGVDCREAD
jgi:protein phosphatase